MKKALFAIVTLTLIYSCSSDTDVKSDSKPTDVQSEIEPGIDSTWNYYSGAIGYNNQIVMELSINGEDVQGTYMYTKHKKRIRLQGTIDTLTREVKLTESVKGKTTGIIKFKLSEFYAQGSWRSPESTSSYDSQNFFCDVIELDQQEHMKPKFSEYKLGHLIEVYDPEIDEFENKESSDVLSIVEISKANFIFDYSVIGHNYHNGEINGSGKMITPKLGQFSGEEGCELRFKFYSDSVIIEEENCDVYRGHRAYFGGTLLKQ